jgi:hypothetical protein
MEARQLDSANSQPRKILLARWLLDFTSHSEVAVSRQDDTNTPA